MRNDELSRVATC